jgi:L-lactate permease
VAFDRNRPVPWQRLSRIFLIYAVVANAMLFLVDRRHYGVGVIVGTIFGGLIYMALAALLCKFGWQPRSFSETRALRAEQAAARAARRNGGSAPTAGSASSKAASAADRARPAPTRRTASGVGRQRPPSRR